MTVKELKEYIFNNEKIEYVLDKLDCHNIQYHDKRNYYSASFPDGDNPQGINIKNTEYLGYRSYTRDVDYEDKQDIISLVEYIKKCDFKSAVAWLHKLFNLKNTYKKTKSIKIKDPCEIFKKYQYSSPKFDVNDIQYLNENLINDYVPLLYIDWYKEGIMPWTAKKFGLAYSYRRKRVIIPLRHWETGKLLGTNARTTVDNHKELGIKKYFITPSYPKHLNLYGLFENKSAIQKAGYVVVVEAEKSVLKRDSKNDSTLVALSGHTISDIQIAILKELNVEIVIALDKDISIEEVRSVCSNFYGYRVSYMFDKYNLLKDKESPADKSNKIYNFLFQFRTVYDEEEHKKYLESLKTKG